tara:strand:+ start:296 stop:1495 length:1200 start_codon:yes stop_codon:yes gene_type:complete
MKRQNITIHGSTGTIGKNTLSVIAKASNQYKVFALSAKSKINTLFNQIKKFSPKYAVVISKEKANQLSNLCKENNLTTKILFGADSYDRVSSDSRVDCVLSGISGTSALRPTYTAIQSGKKLLLANKESLIMSGELMIKAALKSGSQIIPIDSEHNALFQILSPLFKTSKIDLRKRDEISKIILTASGGPFLNFKRKDLRYVTPDEATKHPNWEMGKKISVDSATMMNKGLEIIEASILYGIDYSKIDVLIHPQSIIHALVTFSDGSTISHLSNHDMKIPISYALSWPKRFDRKIGKQYFSSIDKLTLRQVKKREFPCLDMCIESIKIGKNAPTIINAANEVAVEHFLDHSVKFTDIPIIIKTILDRSRFVRLKNIDDVIECNKETRKLTTKLIESRWK